MNLSKNFTLDEFCRSARAIELNIENKPSEQEIENLNYLCEKVLQPIRDSFGYLIVSSGYRCQELNKAIGGAKTSQHTKGEAADIKSTMFNHEIICEFIQNNLDFDQLILEPTWMHVSIKKTGLNRKETLIAKLGKNGVMNYEFCKF